MKEISTLAFLILTCVNLLAQKYAPNELVIESTQNLSSIIQNDQSLRSFSNIDIDRLSIEKHYYKLTLRNAAEMEEFKSHLEKNSQIVHVGLNYYTTNRAIPNDPFYSQLDFLSIINAEDAWDITTGGMTSDGREIVLAIIDDGFDINHEDLIDNIWVNEGEVPDDGIDNDGNGYIDDYYGLNNRTDNDDHPLLAHGTSVAGIAGAKGDNNIGITGVNWNVKLMFISSGGMNADIIECYEYIREQRKRYNESDGADGAFIVATNASWGIANRWAEDFPVWCSLYDELGEEGVLSVAATANSTVDISVSGDMPSTCASKYLIVVSNMDETNMHRGGFGPEFVDISAPGHIAYSTVTNDAYNSVNGTSSAAPMVTGAIGLMYSVNSAAITGSNNTGDLACFMKDAIMNNSRVESTFAGRTESEGVLDIRNTLDALINCEGNEDGSALSLCSISPNPARDLLLFDLVSPPNNSFDVIVRNEIGKLIFAKTEVAEDTGTASFSIPVNDFPAGVYFLTVLNEEEKSSMKFIKL